MKEEGRRSEIVPLIEPSLSFIDSSLQRKLDSPALDVLPLLSSWFSLVHRKQPGQFSKKKKKKQLYAKLHGATFEKVTALLWFCSFMPVIYGLCLSFVVPAEVCTQSA